MGSGKQGLILFVPICIILSNKALDDKMDNKTEQRNKT